jgi:hypothetical protein
MLFASGIFGLAVRLIPGLEIALIHSDSERKPLCGMMET